MRRSEQRRGSLREPSRWLITSPAKRSRSFPANTPKPTRQVGLVAQTATQRDVTQLRRGVQQQVPSPFDAPVHHVGMHGGAERTFESVTQVPRADIHDVSQGSDVQAMRKIRLYIEAQSLRLPWCEAPNEAGTHFSGTLGSQMAGLYRRRCVQVHKSSDTTDTWHQIASRAPIARRYYRLRGLD